MKRFSAICLSGLPALLLLACSSPIASVLGRPAPSLTPTPQSGGWVLIPPAGLPGYENPKSIWLELLPKGETVYSSASPNLVLLCIEGEFEVRIVIRKAAESPWPHKFSTVRIRFDTDEPMTSDAYRSLALNALILQDPESYLEPLLTHDEMVFEYTPFQLAYPETDSIAITFDLRGLAVAIKPLVKACNLPIHQ